MGKVAWSSITRKKKDGGLVLSSYFSGPTRLMGYTMFLTNTCHHPHGQFMSIPNTLQTWMLNSKRFRYSFHTICAMPKSHTRELHVKIVCLFLEKSKFKVQDSVWLT